MDAVRKSAGTAKSLTPGYLDGVEVRALVGDSCEAAAQAVAIRHGPAAVHAARQGLKRARALLRLLEDAGVEEASILRAQLAAKARELSPLRDAHVVAKCARRLADQVRPAQARVLRQLAAGRPARPGKVWWQEWFGEVAVLAQAAASLEVGGCDPATVIAAMDTSARRMRRRARRAKEKPTLKRVHDWRKAVVVLREQLAVVRSETDETYRRLRRLSDRLGKATDAAVLLTAIEKRPSAGANAKIARKARQEHAHAVKRAQRTWKKIPQRIRRLD